jgi:hypothetical protein
MIVYRTKKLTLLNFIEDHVKLGENLHQKKSNEYAGLKLNPERLSEVILQGESIENALKLRCKNRAECARTAHGSAFRILWVR